MLDKYTDPHDPNEHCGDEHCCSHNVCEPTDENVYRVCLECGHVFRTESDFIEAQRGAILKRLIYTAGDPEQIRAWGEQAKKALEGVRIDPEQVASCPFCSHDF